LNQSGQKMNTLGSVCGTLLKTLLTLRSESGIHEYD